MAAGTTAAWPRSGVPHLAEYLATDAASGHSEDQAFVWGLEALLNGTQTTLRDAQKAATTG